MKAPPIAMILGLLLVGCAADGGSATDPPAVPTPADTPAPPRVGPDGPEQPDVGPLVAYGERNRDVFGGLYVEPPGSNRVVMLFTDDLEAHAAEVNDILPGTRVRQVAFTEAALVALLESFDFEALAAEGIEMVGGGVDTIGNKVTLELKSNDPTVELRLEAAHGGMLDVTVYPVPGEWTNATDGDGWRLLAARDGSGADAYTVRAATTVAEWGQLAQELGIEPAQPHPDLATEVVVAFFHGVGSSCPEVRLDAVEIEDGVVYSVTSDPLAPRACTADLAGAAVFVVALERDALPPDGFTLRLSRETVTCADCGFSEEIEVSLP